MEPFVEPNSLREPSTLVELSTFVEPSGFVERGSFVEPRTLAEAVAAFANPQVAHDYFVAARWSGAVVCPRQGCGSSNVAKVGGRNAWRCRACDRQFTAKIGTIFEDSPIGFERWLPAMWLIADRRHGMSLREIARDLAVTEKTAWFMLHRLSLATRTAAFKTLIDEREAGEVTVRS